MPTTNSSDLLPKLAATPALVRRIHEGLSSSLAATRPSQGGFSFVEHVWHLADLEREGYGTRISRLLEEEEPMLPDFEGDQIARERRYIEKSVPEGLERFERFRAENLQRLKSVRGEQWRRSGKQEGVGRVTLQDIPRMMVEHDLSHFRELAQLLGELLPVHPCLAELAARAGSLPGGELQR